MPVESTKVKPDSVFVNVYAAPEKLFDSNPVFVNTILLNSLVLAANSSKEWDKLKQEESNDASKSTEGSKEPESIIADREIPDQNPKENPIEQPILQDDVPIVSGKTTTATVIKVPLSATLTTTSNVVQSDGSTVVDTLGNILAGNLTLEWVQDSIYSSGVSPFNLITFEVVDPADSAVIGEQAISPGPVAYRSVVIPLTKTTSALQ